MAPTMQEMNSMKFEIDLIKIWCKTNAFLDEIFAKEEAKRFKLNEDQRFIQKRLQLVAEQVSQASQLQCALFILRRDGEGERF